MTEFHPDPGYGVEIRDGFTEDDYVANARGFRSTAEFREYFDADDKRRAEIRESRSTRNENNEDLKRFVRLAGLI